MGFEGYSCAYCKGFRCELCGGQVGSVEFDADHPEQSFQRAAAPGRIDRFMGSDALSVQQLTTLLR
jgi:hypothetical protein